MIRLVTVNEPPACFYNRNVPVVATV